MIDTIVTETIAALLISVPFMVVAVLVNGHRRDVRSARHRAAVVELREQLGALLAEDPKGEHAFIGLLSKVDRSVAEHVLHPLMIELSGRAEELLRTAAVHANLADGLERRTRSLRWRQRRRAAFLLGLRPDDDGLVTRLLRDRKPVVAHVAADSIGQATTVAAVVPLIEMLSSNEPHLRFAAQHALIRMRDRATEPLIKHIETTLKPNDTVWALGVAVHIASPDFADVAVAIASHPSPKVRSVVARLLGAIGATDTTEVLVGLLLDNVAEVRVEAIEALGRTGWSAAAPQLGRSLSDQSFAVRQAAARALTRLGAVGELVLRHHTRDEDRFAAEAANSALISLTSHREVAALA
ncbi:MAG: HEAT repeat domain-containing protein [Actinomycetia bacterium]|nr:HEAT repeat domain-containing protein [Actinomycetes bacterium]MCP4957811.1 HEAT repeat domain-containing protein [Actinomycetes bacterium]